MMYRPRRVVPPRVAHDVWARREGRASASLWEILSSRPADATRIEQIEKWISDAMQNYRTSS
jgi:hypothetical protein